MKPIVRVMLIVALASPACSAGGYRGNSQAAAKHNGLVIVPFAVPVAVPVAVVRQPSVLYSYRGYAQQYAAPASVPSTPQAAPDDAAAILTRHCAACHRGTAAQGQLTLLDTGGLIGKLPRRRILEAVESGRMPQPLTSPRLTPAEIEVLRRWAQPPLELVY